VSSDVWISFYVEGLKIGFFLYACIYFAWAVGMLFANRKKVVEHARSLWRRFKVKRVEP